MKTVKSMESMKPGWGGGTSCPPRSSCHLVFTLFILFSSSVPQAPIGGTSSLSGVVVDAQTGKPLDSAQVTIQVNGKSAGDTQTDAAGRFQFSQLAFGAYEVSARLATYLDALYGQKKPGRPGMVIAIAAGQRIADLTIRMTRGGVITGFVLNAAGRPAPGTAVSLLRPQFMQTGPTLNPVAPAGRLAGVSAVTDDRGQYRLWGLAPGECFILAQPGNGYVRVFYPSALMAGQATSVTLQTAEERAGIDIVLPVVPLVGVRGTVTAPGGQVISGGTASLVMDDDRKVRDMYQPRAAVEAGRFAFPNVVPGPYTLLVSSAPPFTDNPPAGTLWGSSRVSVGNVDVNGLNLVLQPGVTVAGRARFEDANPPAAPPSIFLSPVGGTNPLRPGEYLRARLDPQGRFAIGSVPPGQYIVSPQNVTAPWSPHTITQQGRSVLTVPLEVGSTDITDLEIALTSHAPAISGGVRDAAGLAVSDCTVIVFPVDKAAWTTGASVIRTARPASDGQFLISSLFAGAYYVVAVDDVEPEAWFDPRYLEGLAALSTRVVLADGERKAIDLRVVSGGHEGDEGMSSTVFMSSSLHSLHPLQSFQSAMKTFVSVPDASCRFDAKTSFVPSGENIGNPSKVSLNVTCSSPVPSMLMR
jgi:hypothetical protein